MTKKNNSSSIEEKYQERTANLRKTKRISPFWLLPFIALCIGAILFFQIVKERGTSITITFTNGSGIVADKTQIRYQGLQIGIVKEVHFTDNLQKVEVVANINPEASSILRENTKFWLVQPNVSLAGISGLDSLVSGNYITLQPGDGDREDEFIAEEQGPIAQVSAGDLLIHLISDDLGSISIGASVYFKKLPVGKIYDYRINKNNKVEIDVVIDKAYAKFVKKDSRFWNISGINANISPSGLNLNVESLNAVVQGAVSFDSPADSPKADENSHFTLYTNLKAAKRGIEIKVTIPASSALIAGQTEVYSQDNAIGILAKLSAVENNDEILEGSLLIDPNQASLFKANSKIVLRNKKIDLGNLAEPKKFFRGEYFDVIAGDGETKHQFNVIKENELLLNAPNTLVLTLTAPENHGVSEGQNVFYNNMIIGQIVSQTIDVNGVQFKAAIASEYRNLIHEDTQFVAATNFDINIGLDGLRFESATPEKWLQGGVRVLTKQAQGKAKTSYPLYQNISNAEHGITGDILTPTITLHTQTLPSIDKGSLVLYRQFEVGKILSIKPKTNSFDVEIYIYPAYQHLLTNKSRFWVESAAKIDVSPKGISIQATPLARSLKGAISFDNGGSGNNRTLYANESYAKSIGFVITLITDDATNLSKGMNLRYLGLDVGQIDSIQLDAKAKRITAKALINPNYMNIIAKEGANFTIISPQISAGGIDNLDSLLQPYIDIEIGNGNTKTQFNLAQTAPQRNKFSNGTPFILETRDAMNLSEGSPILYRGVEVGTVKKFELNSLGDRVLVHITIMPKYSHLVRQNTEFWIASGYDFSLGWKGAVFNTGSVQQLLKGGISFSTPAEKEIQPQAQPNKRFLLQINRPEEVQTWGSGALSK